MTCCLNLLYTISIKIIEVVANIYKDDYTVWRHKKKDRITTGIRQGCTGSTILFKMVTYMIMAEVDKIGKGYNDEHISLKSLFFAVDALMLSHSLKDAKGNFLTIHTSL